MPPPPEGLPPAVPVGFANDPAVLCYGLLGDKWQQRISVSSSELEEWTLDDELLAAMEAREDKELGFDEMNDETFHSEEWRGRNREPRMYRCAVDALKLKERCKRFRRVRFAEDVIINERERKEMVVTMEEEPREAVKWWQFVTSTKMLHTKRLQWLCGEYVSI